MVTIGKADYIQPSIVKLGITAMAKVAAEVEQAGALCVQNAFYRPHPCPDFFELLTN
jgi:hypothetical protein